MNHSPWNSPSQNTRVGSRSLLQEDLPNSGIEPRSPTWQADSLSAEPSGKPKNTGVGSLQWELPNPGIKQGSPTMEANSLATELLWKPKVNKRLPRRLSGKESTCQCRREGFNPWAGKILWKREWLPTPVLLPGEFYGQKSLVSIFY